MQLLLQGADKDFWSISRGCTGSDKPLPYLNNSSGDEIANVNFYFYAMHPVQNVSDFAEIAQNNGHYAVQGHSRSPISVPIESSYATSY